MTLCAINVRCVDRMNQTPQDHRVSGSYSIFCANNFRCVDRINQTPQDHWAKMVYRFAYIFL